MKRLFSIIMAVTAAFTMAFAQPGQSAMTFVGKSDFYVTMNGAKAGETTQLTDTLLYAGSDFTLPSMKYGNMIIPSFTIKGTTYTGGYAGVTWEDQTFTAVATDATGAEKTITGKSLKGALSHGGGVYKVQLEVTFQYGTMPFPITYSIDSYYVKDYSGDITVTIDKEYEVKDVTYRVRRYMDGDAEKLDVEVPQFNMNGTTIGNLTSGGYTVCGIEKNTDGTFERDYTKDGLSMLFKSSMFENIYDIENLGLIKVAYLDGGKVRIENSFKPGAMPFAITTVLDQSIDTGIREVVNGKPYMENGKSYMVNGTSYMVNGTKGLVIINGKKVIK